MPTISGLFPTEEEFDLTDELDEAPNVTGMPQVQVKYEHLRYLSEFRVQQCPLFANHKCPLHKPFTCFYWHFPNQKRRRPQRRSDGTFSYSPDVYCEKYDDVTGECENGDGCPYLHRNAGDTERRYHLRYYKTGTCIYETDLNGQCLRNGAHCAFAHGSSDLRVPVYDVREAQETATEMAAVNLPASLEKERVLAEDPKWNDMAYVLANYKTEACKKPPRMCRQGYACPYYHNSRDRRRTPLTWRYRSTPCPSVKKGDDWQDSTLCTVGDACSLCHTRTEQQFHLEIFKSTRCNDMVQNSYCPRGAFCAFAHNDDEMQFGRAFLQQYEASTALSGTPVINRGMVLSEHNAEAKAAAAAAAALADAQSELLKLLYSSGKRQSKQKQQQQQQQQQLKQQLYQQQQLRLQQQQQQLDQQPQSAWNVPLRVQTAIGSERISQRLRNSNSNSSSGSGSHCSEAACSPIITAEASPFANPHADLQLLQLQQEVQKSKQKATAMREARDLAVKQRSLAVQQLQLLHSRIGARIEKIVQITQTANCEPEQLNFVRSELIELAQLCEIDSQCSVKPRAASAADSRSSSRCGSDTDTEKNFADAEDKVDADNDVDVAKEWQQTSPKLGFFSGVAASQPTVSEAGKR